MKTTLSQYIISTNSKETAILGPGQSAHIVEKYKTYKDARPGHCKWVSYILDLKKRVTLTEIPWHPDVKAQKFLLLPMKETQ